VVALALQPLRLGGLAAAAAFLVAMQLVSGIQFSPLTATRKIVLLAMAAPVAGVLIDFAFKPTRLGAVLLAAAAGAGAFLLPQMLMGRRSHAGGTFTLPAMLIGGLIATGAMVLAKLPWYALLVLALVPLAVRLPGPERAPVWLQAVIFSLYGFAVAGLACFLAWP